MKPEIFQYIASGLLIFWGLAHAVPVRGVLKGFGEIGKDNQRILVMEWLNESLTLLFLGGLILLLILSNGFSEVSKKSISLAIVILLACMAILSLFTGAKIRFLPFRLCPLIFSLAGILILLGLLL